MYLYVQCPFRSANFVLYPPNTQHLEKHQNFQHFHPSKLAIQQMWTIVWCPTLSFVGLPSASEIVSV